MSIKKGGFHHQFLKFLRASLDYFAGPKDLKDDYDELLARIEQQ